MEAATIQTPPPTRKKWKIALANHGTFAGWCAISFLIGLSLVAGLAVRRATWDVTSPIRFGDIQNGFRWAMNSSGPQGYLDQYDRMDHEEPGWGIWLDYAPLRLLLMDQWGHWVRRHYPQPREIREQMPWHTDYAFNQPVLDFNTAMDLLGAVCAFFLTRLWVIRTRYRKTPPIKPPPFAGVIPGLIAALTLWFNPAMLLSAYGWPTWDAWIVPMYLLGALLASLDWWFCAGLAIAVGAMFKGQQLTVAPVFILWPLVMGQLGSAARWCAGLTVGMAAIASPWLFSYLTPEALYPLQVGMPFNNDAFSPEVLAIHRIVEYPAIFWVVGVIAVTALAPIIVDRIHRKVRIDWLWRILAGIAIFTAAIWPWLLARNRNEIWLGMGLSALLAIAAVCLRRGARPFIAAGAGGAACLLCMVVFHGSRGWWDCGFHFGTIHWTTMIMGHTDNLPGLLQVRYQWPDSALETATTIAPLSGQWPMFAKLGIWPAVPMEISSKQLFDSIYIVLLLISGVGLGLQARRRDPRFLTALITPWVLFFTIPVQIHERYLLFAAGAAAICIGQSVGAYLLGLFLSFVTLLMTLHVMMINGASVSEFGGRLSVLFPWLFPGDCGPTIFKYVGGTYPDAAWGVIIAAGVFLYLSLAPTPRRLALGRASPESQEMSAKTQ